MKCDFEVVIIGGGAAGLFADSVANALGAKTCLSERERLGGDCTWFGCMPSKAILKSASLVKLFKKSSSFGLGIDFKLDTSRVMDHVRDVVREISTHHPIELFEERGIKVIIGQPHFINKGSLKVNDRVVKAKKFIVCTGSHPVIPPIEGLKEVDYLTNENIFDLKVLPKSLVVLGGGPIGVELSQALSRLGVKVSIVEMVDKLLFREEEEASRILEEVLNSEGLDIFTGKKAVKVSKKEGKISVTLEDKAGKREEIFAENILVAVGRAANLEGLRLDVAGVEYTNKGIKVDAYLKTKNPNILACGDVIGPYMFSHVAAYQASVCVRNALFRRIAWQKASYDNMAWAIFTDPEVAHLGLTEEEAKGKFKNIKIYKTDYSACDRAITDSEKKGLVKIITDKKGYILGANIVGANAGEIIQGLLVVKSLKQQLAKVASVLFIYPTLSELIKKTAAKNLVEKADNRLIKFVLKILRKS